MAGLFRWGGRKDAADAALAVPVQAPEDPSITSKVLPKFLATLSSTPSPVLLNLGPVVGQNISFFGDRLSCKIFVEDLFKDVDALAAKGSSASLADALEGRFTHPRESIDGILCWDLFDFLDRRAAQALAGRLVALLRPGGVLYGFFGTAPAEVTQHTRFIVEAPDRLRLKACPSPKMRRQVLVTRDVNRMFEGLVVAESVLLKSATRETLFRKP